MKLNSLHIGTNSQQPVSTHVMQIADSSKCVRFKCEFQEAYESENIPTPIFENFNDSKSLALLSQNYALIFFVWEKRFA